MAGQPSLMHVVFVHGDSGVGIRVEKELTTHPEVWERHSGGGAGPRQKSEDLEERSG